MAATLSMTFDDHFVDNWTAARSVFDAYNARVTFCICRLHRLNEDQIRKLHQLQDEGHEIGYHTRSHPLLTTYLETHGLQSWCKQELDRGIAEHHAAGFPARSFASPHHLTTPQTRSETIKRFAVTRGSGPFNQPRPDVSRRIYTEPRSIVHNLGSLDFQRKNHLGWDWTHYMLDQVKQHQGTAVFVGHDIRAKVDGQALYCTLDDLDRFLDAAAVRGIGFSRLSDMNPNFAVEAA